MVYEINFDNRTREIAGILLAVPNEMPKRKWGEIADYPGRDCPKKIANEFLFCCLIDLQTDSDIAWNKGYKFIHRIIGNPEDIWAVITGFSEETWKSKYKEFGIHWLRSMHNRLWRIGTEIRKNYDGDANRIWHNQEANEVLCRLLVIRAGEQISRMIVGALRDVGQITGTGNVKADTHVCRVLGRSFYGERIDVDKAVKIANQLNPEDPWKVDWPLWFVGKKYCKSIIPRCSECYLETQCTYASVHSSRGLA